MTAQQRDERLRDVRKRLKAYREMEIAILDGTATKEYRTSLTGTVRYDVSLAEVQKMISQLEKQENALTGVGGLKFVRIVQCDNVGRDGKFTGR